jgi:hypothetical protein
MPGPIVAESWPFDATPEGRSRPELGTEPSPTRGVVVIEGVLAGMPIRAVENLVRVTARQIAGESPGARILEWRWPTNESFHVTTSTEQLAYRIAEAVKATVGVRLRVDARHKGHPPLLILRSD